MRKRASATAAAALILAATLQPSEAFFFGLLSRFFQPYPIVGIQTFVEPTAIGTAYVNAVPFNTPPARESWPADHAMSATLLSYTAVPVPGHQRMIECTEVVFVATPTHIYVLCVSRDSRR